ncbi:hypothetical protein [Rosistilla ulvae]|nr:hypothetical protein [Rosistilla ulvae]
MRLLTFAMLLLLPFGCNRHAPTKPITNDQLSLRSRSAMHYTTVQLPGTDGQSPVSVSQDEMQRLIAALHPITRVSSNPLIGDCYTLAYQAGMDHTWVRVQFIGDDSFMFEWDDIVYIGGDAAAFQAVVDGFSPGPEDGG